MGKVNSITKLEIAIFVFLTMMISGASSIASNDFIRIIVDIKKVCQNRIYRAEPYLF